MKKIFESILIALGVLALSSCQEPEAFIPDTATGGINSLTASFPNDDRAENSFSSEIDHENHVITVVVPYTYPALSDQHLEMSDLTNMRMIANLDDNVSVEPVLLFMDLSKENTITVINQRKERIDYLVKAEIRKSRECAVTAFKLVDDKLEGVINETSKTISLVFDGVPSPQCADVELSFGAKITSEPNPVFEECDYSSDFTFTVTAQDGVTKADYTVKVEMPAVLEKGMRPNSGKILWNMQLKADYSLAAPLLTNSMAVTTNYVVLNTRSDDFLVIDRKTGRKVRTVAPPAKGNLENFTICADNGDNILLSNLGNDLKVYRINIETGETGVYFEYSAGAACGRKLSIAGSLDSDAIITMPLYQSENAFLRWTVRDGVLNPTPEKIVINYGFLQGWVYNADVAYSSATDTNADYFLNSYAKLEADGAGNDRGLLWINGSDNSLNCMSPRCSPNWTRNSVDYVKFNGVGFLAAISINSFNWGSDDIVTLYDLGDGNLDNVAWQSDKGIYGSWANISEANGNGTGDVALRVSEDGYYMYLYFFFSGGQIVAVQYDCLDM